MIRVTLEPERLICDQSGDLIVRLTNTGRGPCTNVVFKLTLPVQIVLLQGSDRLEAVALEAGQSVTRTLRVRPKREGVWAVTSGNFSYRDAGGQPRRVSDLRLEVTVAPAEPEPVLPEPELRVTLHTAELPLGAWETLEGRVENSGGVGLQQVQVRASGRITCDPRQIWQTLGALPPASSAPFRIPVRADEAGAGVPICVEAAYTDSAGRSGRREHTTSLRVSAPAPPQQAERGELFHRESPAAPFRPRILRIVVASSDDVRAERDALEAMAVELNRGIAADRGLRLEVAHWETDAYPGFHPEGPQGLTGPILRIEECDLLVGIFWKRTGAEHEFHTAHETWKRTGRPQLMVYFNQSAYAPKSKAEAEQWGRVLEFQQNFPREGLWWPYKKKAEFERLVRNHLTQWIRRSPEPGRQG